MSQDLRPDQVIPFLRSLIANNEPLTAQDVEDIERAFKAEEEWLVVALRDSLESNNAFEYDDPTLGTMTAIEGNIDVIAESIAVDILVEFVMVLLKERE